MKINLNKISIFSTTSPYKPSSFKLDLASVQSFKSPLATINSRKNESTSSIDCETPLDANESPTHDNCRSELTFNPVNCHSTRDNYKMLGEQTPSYVGLPAIKTFNNKYKVCNKASFSEENHSSTFAYLRACETTRRPPRLNGIAKIRGVSTDLNIKYAFQQLLLHRRHIRKGIVWEYQSV